MPEFTPAQLQDAAEAVWESRQANIAVIYADLTEAVSLAELRLRLFRERQPTLARLAAYYGKDPEVRFGIYHLAKELPTPTDSQLRCWKSRAVSIAETLVSEMKIPIQPVSTEEEIR